MNRHGCRIPLMLGLIFLVVCLPVHAAHGDHSGPSSANNDPGGSVSPAGSGDTPADSGGNAPAAPDNGQDLSSPSPAAAGAGGTASGDAPGRDSPPCEGAPARAEDTPAGSARTSGPSGTAAGRAEATPPRYQGAGNGGADPGAGGGGGNGMPETVRGEGSTRNAKEGNAAPIPAAQEQPGGPGRQAGTMGSPAGIEVARFASGSGSSAAPGAGPGHGPFPQRQQHGPPAHSKYPCGPAPATALPAASGQTRDESKEETLPRQRSKRSGTLSWIRDPAVPESGASSVHPPALFPFSMLLFGGFRRISRKNVLEHEARNVIYQAIAATPGTDARTLADMTGINANTLRYHLDRLVATGKISTFARPGVVRYFPNQGAFTPFEHRVFHYLWTDTPRGILRLLHQNPGLTRQHIADALMIAGPSVTRQMDNLIEDGIVENRVRGRSNHYFLTAGAALALGRAMSRAFALHRESETIPVAASAG